MGQVHRHSPRRYRGAGASSLTPAVPWGRCIVTHPGGTVGLVHCHSPRRYRGAGASSLTPAVPWGWCIVTHPGGTVGLVHRHSPRRYRGAGVSSPESEGDNVSYPRLRQPAGTPPCCTPDQHTRSPLVVVCTALCHRCLGLLSQSHLHTKKGGWDLYKRVQEREIQTVCV